MHTQAERLLSVPHRKPSTAEHTPPKQKPKPVFDFAEEDYQCVWLGVSYWDDLHSHVSEELGSLWRRVRRGGGESAVSGGFAFARSLLFCVFLTLKQILFHTGRRAGGEGEEAHSTGDSQGEPGTGFKVRKSKRRGLKRWDKEGSQNSNSISEI